MKRLLFLLLVLSVVFTGNSVSAYAAEKEVTYREQNSNVDTNLVFLKPGESIDLKFIGVGDYKNYERVWTSSNPAVATVNQSGVITAKKSGMAVIKFVLSNSPYVTKGCTVVVSEQYDAVEIADSKGNPLQKLTLEKGRTSQLYLKNLNAYRSGDYSFTWISDNESVVTVNNGQITAKNAGTATVHVQIKDISTGDILPNIPLAVTVPGKVTVTPTPSPAARPSVTATPVPTKAPESLPKDVDFGAEVLGDSKINLTFHEPVAAGVKDIHVMLGKTEYPVDKIGWNQSKTVATLYMEDAFGNGKTYTVSIDGFEKKVQFKTNFPVPDRVVLVWDSLGRKNRAYTQNSDMDLEIPTNLSVEIYAGGLDVTRTWELSGGIEYNLLNSGNISFDFCDDYLLFYDAGDTAQISADFTFTHNKKEYSLSTGTCLITAEKAPAYRVTGALDFAFLPSSSTAMVDWNNPKHTLVANDRQEYTVITMFTDNYGFTYASDRRGVRESMDVRSADDRETPFGALGLDVSYDSSGSGFYVDDNGRVTALEKTDKGMVFVHVTGWGSGNTMAGSFASEGNRTTASCFHYRTEHGYRINHGFHGRA